MAQLIFKETQKFHNPLFWVVLLSTYVPIHFWGVHELVNEYSKGSGFLESETVQAALLAMVVLSLLVVLFLVMKLETRIDASGIQFRYPPFISSWRKISPTDIATITVIKYSPWTYGGWGLRYGWHGWAYNVRGNKGIMIKKKNGKQLLIGTQRLEKAQDAIDNLMKEERD